MRLDGTQEDDDRTKQQCSISKYGFREIGHRRAVDKGRKIRLNARLELDEQIESLGLTDTMCATADSTAIPPNKAPISDPEVLAGRQMAPRECSAGLPPEENDDNDDRVIKVSCDNLGTIATRVSAAQSNPNEH